MTTQEEFFQQHAVDGALSDQQMAQMLALPTGPADSGDPPADKGGAASAPAVAPAPATAAEAKNEDAGGKPADGGGSSKPEPELNADNAFIAAPDGKHTISYSKLQEARQGEQRAKETAAAATAEAERLRLENEALKKGSAAPAAAEDPATKLLEGASFGDFSEPAIAKGVLELVDKRVAQITEGLTKPLKDQAERSAVVDHFTKIYQAHEDADSIVESQEFSKWIEGQPTYAQKAIQATMAKGSAEDISDVFSSFKQATGTTGAAKPAAAPAKAGADASPDAVAAAAKAIADAKTQPPKSLTEIPAGTTAHHDAADALLAQSSNQLMTQFAGKSADEIMKLMDRTL